MVISAMEIPPALERLDRPRVCSADFGADDRYDADLFDAAQCLVRVGCHGLLSTG